MAVIMVQHAVAIEKGGWTPLLTGNLVLRKREGVRNTDVDEIAVEQHPQQSFPIREKREHIPLQRAALLEAANQIAPEGIYTGADGRAPRPWLGKSRDPASVDLDDPKAGSVCKLSDCNRAGR